MMIAITSSWIFRSFAKSRLAVAVTSYMRDKSCFPKVQFTLVLWKNADKIKEIKADAKWKKIEHMLGLDRHTAAVQAMSYFITFIQRNVLLAKAEGSVG